MTSSKQNNSYFEVARNVWGMKDIFVNIYMVKNDNDNNWVLVDTGLATSANKIKKMASSLFGDTKPSAIILTHGHFDHRGSVMQLAMFWKVPVYTHYLELPYLTGRSSYPPPDNTVGGGMMAWMSFLYPKKPVDITVLASFANRPFCTCINWLEIHSYARSCSRAYKSF